MPIADMAGAAANRIGVARDLGRYNQGQKDQLLGGISAVGDLGAAAVEAQHRAKMEQLLQEQGFDPATAKNLIAAGPHATASALLQKKRDAQQREQQLADVQSQRTWQETQTEGSRMFEQGQQDRQNAFSIQQRQTPTYGETQEDAQRKAYQEALKGASQPEVPPFAGLGALVPGYPKAQPVAPGEGLVRQRMREHGFDYKTQPTENIDPLSPEGVKAQQDVIGSRPAPQGRETPEDAAKRAAAVEAARLAEQKRMGAGSFKESTELPPDQLRVLKSKLSPVELGHLKGLESLLTGSLAGEDEQKAYDAFIEKMVAAHPEGAVSAPRTIGAGGGTSPPPKAPPAAGSQPPGDPKKVQALQAAGAVWDGKEWFDKDGNPLSR